jgi:hypothetical protein
MPTVIMTTVEILKFRSEFLQRVLGDVVTQLSHPLVVASPTSASTTDQQWPRMLFVGQRCAIRGQAPSFPQPQEPMMRC